MPTHDKPYTQIDLGIVSQSRILNVGTQSKFIDEIKRAIRYFFGEGEGSYLSDFPHMKGVNNFPFKGFILSGEPGTGKTEAVKQACSQLKSSLANEGLELRLLHVNSSDVNRAALGSNETRLKQIFSDAQPTSIGTTNIKTVILFDDIETLLVKRTDSHTTEWSRSMNGVFFHELDKMNSCKTLVVATTNVKEMVDDAVHSRLSLREVPPPSFDEMVRVAKATLPLKKQDELLDMVVEKLNSEVNNGSTPSFRMARKASIEILLDTVIGWKGDD